MFLRVCRWYFDSCSNCHLVSDKVSRPYNKRGITYALYMIYDVIGFSPLYHEVLYSSKNMRFSWLSLCVLSHLLKIPFFQLC